MATDSSQSSTRLGEAIVAFALEGRFPESDEVSSLSLSSTDLTPAIEALARAKSELQAEIHTINEETKEDVGAFVRNAKSLQEDIIRSKHIANDIIRQSETPEVSGKAGQAAKEKVEFLNREVQYTQQLLGVLKSIQRVDGLLSEVERASKERRILDSLHLLEESWAAIDMISASKTCRAMRLLDIRSFELKSDVHEVFDHVWKSLVYIDIDKNKIVIYDSLEGEQMTLSDAAIGLTAYKEVAERMEQLWHNLDAAILSPRMDITATALPSIAVDSHSLSLSGSSDTSIPALLNDLEKVFKFLAQKLPLELLQALCAVMMGDVITKLVRVWLDSAVPPALKDLDRFQEVIQDAKQFSAILDANGYVGFDSLKEWVENAPTIWLAKCRETALDSVRTKLSRGIGSSKQVEKIEKQMVSLAEGKELASATPAATASHEEWDAAWADDDEDDEHAASSDRLEQGDEDLEDDGAVAWGWDDKDAGDALPGEDDPFVAKQGEDDAGDAWGWGDDDHAQELPKPAPPRKGKLQVPAKEETREMILKETYHVSSMPEPVLDLIFSMLDDGAALTQPSEGNPVAAAAAGLFGVPTLALALFRAISPYYYSWDIGGNMYLYNDAMYLAERLSDFSTRWKARDDISVRARNMLRMDNDISSLRNFANRAYSNEMSTQKTVLRDLLGGSQSLMQQEEMESCIDSAVARIRSMAVTWEDILAQSVWSQAVGSLADAISTKIIGDVMEMPSIGQDEAYNIAQMIAKVTELDDLFLPDGGEGGRTETNELPTTAQYAATWLRLQYLSQVLQSNLNEVRFLWVESELSLYFTVDEVVDLINSSFEANARTREVIREITQKPHPTQT